MWCGGLGDREGRLRLVVGYGALHSFPAVRNTFMYLPPRFTLCPSDNRHNFSAHKGDSFKFWVTVKGSPKKVFLDMDFGIQREGWIFARSGTSRVSNVSKVLVKFRIIISNVM